MESRRDFLVSSAGLIAGFSLAPRFRPASHSHPTTVVRVAVQNEILRVRYELQMFRNNFLPTLMSRSLPHVAATSQSRTPAIATKPTPSLQEWQAATDDLIRALPHCDGGVWRSSDDGSLADFRAVYHLFSGYELEPPAYRGYELATDWPAIRWHAEPHSNDARDKVAQNILAVLFGRDVAASDAWSEMVRRLPDVRRMFWNSPADFFWLEWAYTNWLPAFAELDPTFAVDGLDFGRMKDSLFGDGPAIGPLAIFLFCAFSSAAQLIATALANNHFLHVRRLLEKSQVRGYWAAVMAGQLSGVLYRKVMTLRRLARAA